MDELKLGLKIFLYFKNLYNISPKSNTHVKQIKQYKE